MNMSERAWHKTRALVAALAVVAGCKRETTAPAETSGAPLTVDADGAGGGGPVGDSKAEPVPETTPPGTSEGVPTSADTGPTEVGTPPEPAPAEVPGDAKSPAPAPEGLPAPLFTKVDDKCGKDPGVGTSAHPFALKTAEGKDISLASLKGKVVLLNFWGTWCKPCLKELPEFDRLVRHYRKHGAVLVAIATDTEPDKVLEFKQSSKVAGKLVLGGDAPSKAYDSPNFPFSFVVDAQGVIRGSYRGYHPECIGKIEQDLRASLEQRRR